MGLPVIFALIVTNCNLNLTETQKAFFNNLISIYCNLKKIIMRGSSIEERVLIITKCNFLEIYRLEK